MKIRDKNTNIHNKRSSKKLIGSILAASLFMFGAASCSPDTNVVDNGVVDENYAVNDPVANTDINKYTAWDYNSDERLDREEFGAGLTETGLYSDWDTDNNNEFTETEFTKGLYNTWDQNSDGFIDNNEYASANSGWENEFGDNFGAWDANNDRLLDNNEFTAGIGDAGFYDTWDTDRDGMLNDNEFYGGLYNSWDYDNDGYLGFNEIGFNDWGI